MRVKTEFPRRVREIQNAWIPMPDGCRLSARVWLPEGAETEPVPAILEYLPYRKDDATAVRDSIRHPYFAGHGYASVRVDMRGSGDSDGILMDEYLPQEQDDALAVLAWLAAQPWCTGDAGMIGVSWGGFAALQVAARRPPELKAVVSLCSTHDRYLDDIHYRGGCVFQPMLAWAATMLAYNARPPDPAVVGEPWRAMWLERMERTPPFIEAWLAHQRRDEYWNHGSVGEDFASIRCPVYLVSGWADWYRNPVLALLEGLRVPRKALIGAWGHVYPEQGAAGSAIGFLQECLRWWDYWLKGIETRVMDGPMLVFWMPERNGGRWVTEESWPPGNVQARAYSLNADGLGETPREEAGLDYRGLQSAAVETAAWGYTGDQRAEDGRSLCFTSPPLDKRLEIFGLPYLTLTIASDRPNALVVARLCDVAPNGVSTLLTRGFLNLTHRESHEEPAPLEPGRRYTVRMRLDLVGHVFLPGHRLRVTVSPTAWPRAWPSPEPVTITLVTGEASRLELPVRSPDARARDASPLRPFEPPEGAEPLASELIGGGWSTTVSRDIASERVELSVRRGPGGYRFPDGLAYEASATDVFSIVEGDPLSAAVRCEHSIAIGREGWRTRVETASEMTSTLEAFLVTTSLEAYEGDTRVFTKSWRLEVARDLV